MSAAAGLMMIVAGLHPACGASAAPPLPAAGMLAHGGGLNRCGCHFDRRAGTCHCHQARACGCECEPGRCSSGRAMRHAP